MASNPFFRAFGTEIWYGSGYCGVCGDPDVIPQACRWWDSDDGTKLGVLCRSCRVEVADARPAIGDYAVAVRAQRRGLTCEQYLETLLG